MSSNKKVIDLVSTASTDSSDEDSISIKAMCPPKIDRSNKPIWNYKGLEILDSSDDEKMAKTKGKVQSKLTTGQKMKAKPYIPSNRNIMSPFTVSKGPFATPNFSVASSNTSTLTPVCSSTSTSSAKKVKTESGSIMEAFNMEHNDPNKVMKMTMGVNTKNNKGFKSPNTGLVIYLKRQAIHLALKADYERKTKDEFNYKPYNKMNAYKLSQIAIMIKRSIPYEIKMDPNGDYTWLKGVGEAFSYLIHSYFLVSEE